MRRRTSTYRTCALQKTQKTLDWAPAQALDPRTRCSLRQAVQPPFVTNMRFHEWVIKTLDWGPTQDLDPCTRWSPRQAAQHPFVTNKRFTGPFQPPPDPHLPLRMPEPADGSGPGVAGSPYGGGGGGPYAYAPPMAAGMATSPEAHATAHAAALAALQARAFTSCTFTCMSESCRVQSRGLPCLRSPL